MDRAIMQAQARNAGLGSTDSSGSGLATAKGTGGDGSETPSPASTTDTDDQREGATSENIDWDHVPTATFGSLVASIPLLSVCHRQPRSTGWRTVLCTFKDCDSRAEWLDFLRLRCFEQACAHDETTIELKGRRNCDRWLGAGKCGARRAAMKSLLDERRSIAYTYTSMANMHNRKHIESVGAFSSLDLRFIPPYLDATSSSARAFDFLTAHRAVVDAVRLTHQCLPLLESTGRSGAQ